jgi:hypothetical protein
MRPTQTHIWLFDPEVQRPKREAIKTVVFVILERWDGVMWTGLVWLRIGTGGGLL